MNSKGIFITATGTDVGKTYVSALVVKKMIESGFSCGYYKPALSGAERQNDNTLLPGDCDYVIKTAGLDIEPLKCVSYCFEEAVSPHLAAKNNGVSICIKKIINDYRLLAAQYEYMVVEGAGGITCPFNLDNDKILLSDVINALDLDVLIIADGGLGTINSVILTVEYAKAKNIRVRGIILNNFEKDNFMHIDNKLQIEKLTDIPVITVVKSGDINLEIESDFLKNLFN